MKALIFAAGKGTRLKPFTDHHPKALAVVNNVPILERNIKYLQSFGINEFVINVHHFGEQIIEFLKEKENFGAKIDISDEKDELLETGGGLIFAKKYLEKGHKIKLSIRFRGREMQFTDKGREVLLRFADELNEIGTLESAPTLDGRNMMAMISPIKK